MNIAEFGSYFNNVSSFEYLSTRTLLDFDMIFIDFNHILVNSYDKQAVTYEKRKIHIEEFIKYKNIPPVYFTPAPKVINVKKGSTSYIEGFDFFTPIPKIETEGQSGSQIEIEPNGLFTNFLLKYKEHFHYNAYFKSSVGTTIVSTSLKKLPLGFWTQNCVFLPPLKSTIKKQEEEFFEDLYSILKKIRNNDQKADIPEWAGKYFLPSEEKLVESINNISSEIELLNKELDEKRQQHKYLVQRKTTFTASGVELEEQIKELLKEIGFKILETENNREDLVVQYKDKIAVIEIKGVNNSSAEKHAAQLEKWAAGYLERTGVKPKPILIVNAYKDKPLLERNEQVFPNQMLKYSVSREHCLLSTLQLLGIYYYVKNNPNEAESQVENLLSTVGIYEFFNKWDEFISIAY